MLNYSLFLIITPGLEELALKEIELKCPPQLPSALNVIKGGIELTADLHWIEAAHTLLKIPVRILMRITEFKVRDFPKLFQKMSSLPWNQFLSHPCPEWEITCHKSRLNHTGKIAEKITEALARALIKQPLSLDWKKKKYPPQTFFIRVVDDVLTLSLDLTGIPLYKRGLQQIKGEAPLRENFAAAMIMELFAGITQTVNLVDPMCGSATLLTEALTFHSPLHLRPFAFETAPFYKGKLLRLPPAGPPLPINEAWGMDTNSDLIKKVQQELPHDLPIKLQAQNSLERPIKTPGEMLMISNPPYGERIKIAGKRGSFLKEARQKYLQQDRPLRLAWVLPADMDDIFAIAPGYRVITKRPFRNGGLPVTLWIWQRNEN